MEQQYHFAQLNVGRIVAPTDDPILHGFMSRLDEINALADSAPGFIWRLQTEEGDATALRPYDDDRILINMSVWRSPEDARAYIYRGPHHEIMRNRRQWFERFGAPYMVCWWIPAGHIPTVAEGKERLDYLTAHGDSAYAFTFRLIFPQPKPAPQPAVEANTTS